MNTMPHEQVKWQCAKVARHERRADNGKQKICSHCHFAFELVARSLGAKARFSSDTLQIGNSRERERESKREWKREFRRPNQNVRLRIKRLKCARALA